MPHISSALILAVVLHKYRLEKKPYSSYIATTSDDEGCSNVIIELVESKRNHSQSIDVAQTYMVKRVKQDCSLGAHKV